MGLGLRARLSQCLPVVAGMREGFARFFGTGGRAEGRVRACGLEGPIRLGASGRTLAWLSNGGLGSQSRSCTARRVAPIAMARGNAGYGTDK